MERSARVCCLFSLSLSSYFIEHYKARLACLTPSVSTACEFALFNTRLGGDALFLMNIREIKKQAVAAERRIKCILAAHLTLQPHLYDFLSASASGIKVAYLNCICMRCEWEIWCAHMCHASRDLRFYTFALFKQQISSLHWVLMQAMCNFYTGLWVNFWATYALQDDVIIIQSRVRKNLPFFLFFFLQVS